MIEDEVRAEIARLNAEITERTERRRELRKLLSNPSVTPVLVYYRHGSKYEEPADAGDTLEQAARLLEYMLDDGQCSPVGVSVGGLFTSQDDLRERFPALQDDIYAR